MQLSLSARFALIALISVCAGMLLLSAPQVSTAEEDASASSTASVNKGKKAKVDAACMQTAVDTREDALKAAWEGFADDITAALGVRKTALHDAWGLTDLKEQKKAIAAAWKIWKKASKDAHTELKKDRKAAWDTFKKTTKDSCKVSAPKDEALGADASGTISL